MTSLPRIDQAFSPQIQKHLQPGPSAQAGMRQALGPSRPDLSMRSPTTPSPLGSRPDLSMRLPTTPSPLGSLGLTPDHLMLQSSREAPAFSAPTIHHQAHRVMSKP